MRRAFTLIEVVVAIGLLAMVLSFAGVIFRVSIDSQRTAIANAEIMQKLRTITDQLNADFKSVRYDCAGYIGFNTDTSTVGGNTVPVNSDCIAFFAAGDFQSTNQYGGDTIYGNVACIYYGQPDPNSYVRTPSPRDKILLRRQTILTADAPSSGSPDGEFYRESLPQWHVDPPYPDPDDWITRPLIDPNNIGANLPVYVAKGVDSFTIEYAQWDPAGKISWTRGKTTGDRITTRAFKFTFTLYDSRGVIRDGRTFTHIVYLAD
jgi:prepilin-type N-terminal cleavage/methylation domain-containing protein